MTKKYILEQPNGHKVKVTVKVSRNIILLALVEDYS